MVPDPIMALFVVATPIGNPQDLSVRAREILASADLVIGEEMKVLRQILKSAGVQAKAVDQLNEHSDARDVQHFVSECQSKTVALVSDCGTPGFCDPGADLVAACVKASVPVHAVPGASSLMSLLSICGVRVERFLFYGFLPAKNELRAGELKRLAKSDVPVIVMETPYRALKLAEDLRSHFSAWFCVVGLNLTREDERVIRSLGRELRDFGPANDPDGGLPTKTFEPIALLIPPGWRG